MGEEQHLWKELLLLLAMAVKKKTFLKFKLKAIIRL
jgi:hypothetical protein